MSPRDLHPKEGARFLFELDEGDDEGARYRASIYTPTHRYDYCAEIDSDGSFQVRSTGAETAGAELEKKLSTMTRLIARDAPRRIGDDLPPWPRRILRWRGPK